MRTYANPFLIVCSVWSLVLVDGLSMVHGAEEKSTVTVEEVFSFFHKYCTVCHDKQEAKGGLVLEDLESLLDGGNRGPVVIPGDSKNSLLIQLLESTGKSRMPPKGALQPDKAGLEKVKQWINAGIDKDAGGSDGGTTSDDVSDQVLPSEVPLLNPVKSAVKALAFHPYQRLLAVGLYRKVLLLSPVDGRQLGVFDGFREEVSAVTFTRDGRHLIAAGGAAGQFGEVAVASVLPWDKAAEPADVVQLVEIRRWQAHQDAVYSVAVSPDGVTIATASYDRGIKLWDLETGRERAALKDHTGAVYSVAFSPDGKLLATASADFSVKIWDVVTGDRLYTLSDALDYVYAVAFHPSGHQIASAGADKRIRIWNISYDSGTLVRSSFAHEGAVIGLRYAPDGKRSYSSGQDRQVKVWDAVSLREEQNFGEQSDWPLSLASSIWKAGETSWLAVGRYDGSLAVYDSQNGSHLRNLIEPLPEPDPLDSVAVTQRSEVTDGKPRLVLSSLTSVVPSGMQRGTTKKFTLTGVNISDATAVVFETEHLRAALVKSDSQEEVNSRVLEIEVTAAPDVPSGVHRLFVRSALGMTGSVSILVGSLKEKAETDVSEQNPEVEVEALPLTFTGIVSETAEKDIFFFDAITGEYLVFESVAGQVGSPLSPLMLVQDSSGATVPSELKALTSGVSVLSCVIPRNGRYRFSVSDRRYRGVSNFFYRIRSGRLPRITEISSRGVKRGTTSELMIEGHNLGQKTITIRVPEEAAVGSPIPIELENGKELVSGAKRVVVGEWDEQIEVEPNDVTAQIVEIPVTINGRITQHSEIKRSSLDVDKKDVDRFQFRARGKDRLVIEVQASRLGSDLDSIVDILDGQGELVPRARVRAISETYLVLRDHGSRDRAMRIQSWSDLAVDDFVMIGEELLKIESLPRGPDSDMVFQNFRDQRLGLLGTTPASHALGPSLYKVQVFPADSRFPDNGMPVVNLGFQNDDGGPTYGADSFLLFDVPKDDDYIVRLRDVRGDGGPSFFYRVTVRKPRPDFAISMTPVNPNIPEGGRIPITVTAERFDGFEGPIQVWMDGLPSGVSCEPGSISEGMFSATLVLSHRQQEGSQTDIDGFPHLYAQAMIDGRAVTHVLEASSTSHVVSILPRPDIHVRVEPKELTMVPGQEQVLKVFVDRVDGFSQRVPIQIQNLPRGVRVLDVGLNGVLVTEEQSSREFVLFAEPWARPQSRSFCAVGRVEASSTTAAEQASSGIVLTITDPVTTGSISD